MVSLNDFSWSRFSLLPGFISRTGSQSPHFWWNLECVRSSLFLQAWLLFLKLSPFLFLFKVRSALFFFKILRKHWVLVEYTLPLTSSTLLIKLYRTYTIVPHRLSYSKIEFVCLFSIYFGAQSWWVLSIGLCFSPRSFRAVTISYRLLHPLLFSSDTHYSY